MGTVYIDVNYLGTFDPQIVGASGKAKVNTTEVGTFNFTSASGVVVIDSTEIGTYSGLSGVAVTVGFIQPTVINPAVIGMIVIHGGT